MKGSKRKRGRKWELRVSTGKRNLQTGRPEYAYAYCDGRLTVREVDKELAKLMHTVETGKYVRPDNPKMTVADCLKWWIEEFVKSPERDLSLKTIQEYERQIENHIIPAIGHIRLLELTAEHIQDFYKSKQQDGARLDGKQGGLSKRSRRLLHTILNQALKKATGKYIPHNPMADLDE
ncbi:MAG: hypothetical protein GY845_15075, partial [Planctomycetes bacterium]|nr:hypothetical protein [Planctomycetota bacterium]